MDKVCHGIYLPKLVEHLAPQRRGMLEEREEAATRRRFRETRLWEEIPTINVSKEDYDLAFVDLLSYRANLSGYVRQMAWYPTISADYFL